MKKYLAQISKHIIAPVFMLALMLVSMMGRGQTAYITNSQDGTVSVIDVAANTVIDTIKVGSDTIGVSVSPDASKVYVANWGDNTVSVINSATNTVSDTIKVGKAPVSFGNFISSYKQPLSVASLSNEANISLYPNPATSQLTIHASSFHDEAVTVSVMNVIGQEVLPSSISRLPSSICISSLPAGMYFLQLKWEGGSVVKKFVKE